jgi:hypothetical protein
MMLMGDRLRGKDRRCILDMVSYEARGWFLFYLGYS